MSSLVNVIKENNRKQPCTRMIICSFIGSKFVHSLSLCPEQGWYHAGSRTCYWMTTVQAGASTTNDYCGLAGGQLAVFTGQTMLDWIVTNLGTNIKSMTTLFWVGLTDATSEGTFITFSGQSAWTSWGNSNPTGVTDKDCVIIDSDNSWKMFDEFCTSLYIGLCSLRLDHCPAGSYYLPNHLVCYWITPPPTRDADANKLLCETDSGALAAIPNAQVDAEFNNPPLSNIFSNLSGHVFIGVNDKTIEGTYTHGGVSVTWTNWYTGQPSDYNIPSLPAEDCVKIRVDTRQWEDDICTRMLQALCYRDLLSFAALPVTYPTTTTTTTAPTTTTTFTTTSTTTTTTSPKTTTVTEATTKQDATTEDAQTTESQGNIQTTEQVTITTQPEIDTTVNIPITTETVNTNQESTTSGSQYACTCPCENQKTYEELQKQIEEMKKELTIDYKTTSAYIRTKTSIYEDRPVAQNLGIVGITILCLVFGSIFLLDIGTFIKQIKKCFRHRSQNV